MTCNHLWLPYHGAFYRYVVCAHCQERRRVKWAPISDAATVADALGEAIDRGVIPNDEVLWGGQRLR